MMPSGFGESALSWFDLVVQFVGIVGCAVYCMYGCAVVRSSTIFVYIHSPI